MTISPLRLLMVVLLAGCSVAAQSPSEPGPTVAALEQRLAAYRHLLADWAGLTRYGSENSEIRPPAAGEQRVVFFGDQITESWRLAEHFPGKPYFNRGIAGQTSPQMLVRFRQDVIGLSPRVVVLLAGTNDIAGFTGPATKGTLGGSHRVDDGSREGERDPRGARIDTAGLRLHEAADGPAPAAENRRLERVAQRARGPQRSRLRRLLFSPGERPESQAGVDR
jgi:hypothetical protein